ncbi:MAG: DUF1326 domain-containing protein [Bryobacter sp.]|nr:DUF1326 domain-containing protein [Bryobacter sp.]
MNKLLLTALATAVAFGANVPKATVTGSYIEARNADVYTGPCYANSEVNMMGNLAVVGWKIDRGTVEGVKVDGLAVVGVLRASTTLGDVHVSAYPVKSVLIVDERADAKQRVALQTFAKRMGGDLLGEVQKVEVRPISLTFADNNLHSVRGKLEAGELARIETRPSGEGDHAVGVRGDVPPERLD